MIPGEMIAEAAAVGVMIDIMMEECHHNKCIIIIMIADIMGEAAEVEAAVEIIDNNNTISRMGGDYLFILWLLCRKICHGDEKIAVSS